MPFKSKAQFRKFWAMANRGEISKAKAREWTKETPSIKSLPERKKKKTARDKYKSMLRKGRL